MAGFALDSLRGGGGSSTLDWQVVDLDDGTWTAPTDPDDIVDTAETADGLTTVTYNAISVGSTVYTWGASVTNLNTWRVSKPLTFGGVALTGADPFMLALEIDNSSGFSDDGASQLFLGVAKVPASTTRATAAMAGLVEQHLAAAGAPDYAAAEPGGIGTILGNAGNTVGRCFFSVYGGALTRIEVIATGGGSTYGPQGRDSGLSYASGDTFHLVVGAGTRGSGTITASDTATAKLRYAVAKLGV